MSNTAPTVKSKDMNFWYDISVYGNDG